MLRKDLAGNILNSWKLFLFSLFLLVLMPNTSATQGHESWTYNLSIYEVNTRQYTHSGTFAEFATHLNRLKDMGVGIIWFMPIHPIGVKNRKGSLGSPYSVRDYYEVNPEFGTMDDFKALVDSIHAKGMYVIMDWVANHTAWDNPLTVTHPEWYVTDTNGNFMPPPGTDWWDVIQLDYSQQGLRDYMIQAMAFWINEADIDGFRCDAVGFVPDDFWSEAINQLKAIKPDLFMLAEDDNPRYQSLGFDMTYAWGFHGWGNGVIDRIYKGTSTVAELDNYMIREQTTYAPDHYRMYFTSNHDENAWFGTVFEQFGSAAETFAVLTATIGGMPLIYGGQEAGLNKRLLFFDKDEIIWQPSPFANLYSTLLNLKKENRALWNGSKGGALQRVNTTNNQRIFAFVRKKETDKIFAVFNLDPGFNGATLLDTLFYGTYVEVFTNDTITFEQAFNVTLPGWGYRVYKRINTVTGIKDDSERPSDFILYQNYPNPFNPSTTIAFSIPQSGLVTLKIFNLLGEEVATLVAEELPAGRYSKEWHPQSLSSGVYFYQLTVQGSTTARTATKKLLLVR